MITQSDFPLQWTVLEPQYFGTDDDIVLARLVEFGKNFVPKNPVNRGMILPLVRTQSEEASPEILWTAEGLTSVRGDEDEDEKSELRQLKELLSEADPLWLHLGEDLITDLVCSMDPDRRISPSGIHLSIRELRRLLTEKRGTVIPREWLELTEGELADFNSLAARPYKQRELWDKNSMRSIIQATLPPGSQERPEDNPCQAKQPVLLQPKRGRSKGSNLSYVSYPPADTSAIGIDGPPDSGGQLEDGRTEGKHDAGPYERVREVDREHLSFGMTVQAVFDYGVVLELARSRRAEIAKVSPDKAAESVSHPSLQRVRDSPDW